MVVSARDLIVPIEALGSRPPLFCVHPINGDPGCYRAAARSIGEDQPVYGIRARGLVAGEAPMSRLTDIAALYIEAVGAVAGGPLRLAGWSVGGVIAYEMARQLEAEGRVPDLLVLIDCRAPDERMRRDPGLEPDRIAHEVVQHRARRSGLSAKVDERDFRGKEGRALLESADRALRALGIRDPAEDIDGLARGLDIFRALAEALVFYEPGPYSGPVTLFETTEELREHPRPPTLGWERHARTALQRRKIAGNHFTLVNEPHAAVLGAELGACIRSLEAAR
jgi:thioesterase domain-containing protein